MKIQQQKTALETSSLCSLNLQLAPHCIHVKKWQTITWLCVRLPIYLFMPLLANLHNYAYYLVQECYYVCFPLVIDFLMVYQNRKELCKLIRTNVQVSSLYVQL